MAPQSKTSLLFAFDLCTLGVSLKAVWRTRFTQNVCICLVVQLVDMRSCNNHPETVGAALLVRAIFLLILVSRIQVSHLLIEGNEYVLISDYSR